MRELLQTIRADLAANSDARGKIAMALFRLSSEPSFPRIVRGPIGVVYTVVVAWGFGIELPPGTRVGPGLRLNHSIGTVINHAAVIGAHCDIKHGCTIGVRRSGEASSWAPLHRSWARSGSERGPRPGPAPWCCRTCPRGGSRSATRRG
jgi:serine acetyltransferase